MTCRSFAAAVLAALFAACGSPPAVSPDAGSPAVDSGTLPTPDAGVPAVDSGTPPAPDAGKLDAGPSDAGSFSLASTVSLVSGASPAGVTVTLEGEGVNKTATADLAGAWRFDGLAPGLYGLSFAGSAPLPPDAGFTGDAGPATLSYSGEIPSVILQSDGGVIQNGQGAVYDSDGGLVDDDAGFIVDVWDASFPLTPLALPAGDRLPGSFAFLSQSLVTAKDGHFAYLTNVDERGTDALWLAGPGGAPVQVATGTGAYGSLSFSPDSRYLAFMTDVDVNYNGTLWVVPATGGTPVQVATGTSILWGFSPDGTRILLAPFPPPSTASLYTIATGVTATVATGSNYSDFSSDGTEIAVGEKTSDGGMSVVVYTVATGASTTISPGEAVSFSPAGNGFAMMNNDTIDLYGPDGGTTEVTTTGWGPTWSPNGAYLAYLGASADMLDGTLHLYTVATGNTVLVAATADPLGLEFSPDATSLAFFTSTGSNGAGPLNLYTIASATTVSVATSADSSSCSFTGDGKEMLVAASPSYDAQGFFQDCTLDIYRIASEQTVQVATGVTDFFRSQDWIWLAFFSGTPDANGNSTLSLAPVATGIVAQTVPDAYNFEFLAPGIAAVIRNAAVDGAGTLAVFAPGAAPVPVNDWVTDFWFSGSSLVSARVGTPGPFGYMDGLWVTPLP